jgi:hypothetical protein
MGGPARRTIQHKEEKNLKQKSVTRNLRLFDSNFLAAKIRVKPGRK